MYFVKLVLGAIAIVAPLSTLAADASYPSKPIRFVVPQPPGGASDIYARIIAQKIGDGLGQKVIIENKAGASGNIGADAVAKATPDGYTLLLTPSATLTVNPSLYAKMPFTIKEFAPIADLVDMPFLLLVNPNLPTRSVSELVDYAKKNPSKLNYASSGSGQMVHLAAELFKTAAGVKIEHVAYKGAGQSVPDVIAGQVQMMFLSIPASIQFVKVGQLRALGVSSLRRSSATPDVPTIAEAGIAGFEAGLWLALVAPAGTAGDVVQKLNAATRTALQDPALRQRFDADGTLVLGSSPAELARKMELESAKWAKVISDIGIKAE